jgi:hypothetical protein
MTEIYDNETIANKFNDYFINSVVAMNQNIDDVDGYELLIDNIFTKFEFRSINKNYVEKVINGIKPKYGVDSDNMRVIKDSFAIVGDTIVSMINKSLNSGIVPSVLKISTVVPIQKVAKTMNCAEKILEIVVKNQLSQYIENNNILIPQQS